MSMQIAFGFVFGRMWAKRRGVKSGAAQNRAGLMMGIGGITPVGAVLANTAINNALDGQKADDKVEKIENKKEK